MIDWAKPLQTRDGREVRIYARDHELPYSVVGAYLSDTKRWQIYNWQDNGNVYMSLGEARLDLVNVPVAIKISGYVNIYPDEAATMISKRPGITLAGVEGPCPGGLHPTAESARESAKFWQGLTGSFKATPIAIAVPVTIETVEGFGLPPAKAEDAAPAPSSGTDKVFRGACPHYWQCAVGRLFCRLRGGHTGDHDFGTANETSAADPNAPEAKPWQQCNEYRLGAMAGRCIYQFGHKGVHVYGSANADHAAQSSTPEVKP